jgi:hypothetical protein
VNGVANFAFLKNGGTSTAEFMMGMLIFAQNKIPEISGNEQSCLQNKPASSNRIFNPVSTVTQT